MPLQLRSRITVQSTDYGSATRGAIALQALAVEIAQLDHVQAVFETMRADREHRRRIAHFYRLVKTGQTSPHTWQESRLQEPNPVLGSALDNALVDLFGRHVPHICLPLLQAFLASEWIRLTGCSARLDFWLNGMPTDIPPPDYPIMPSRDRKKAAHRYAATLAARGRRWSHSQG